MSTTPSDAWRDAGLEIPDETTSLEDYHPGAARPDLDGAADEADVAEQAVEQPDDDPDDLGDPEPA